MSVHHVVTYGSGVVFSKHRAIAATSALERKPPLHPSTLLQPPTSEVALQCFFFCCCCICPSPLSRWASLAPSLYSARRCTVQSTWTRHGPVKLATLTVAKQRNAKNGHGLVSACFPLVFLEKCPRPPTARMIRSRAAAREIARLLLVKWVQTRLAIGGEGLF